MIIQLSQILSGPNIHRTQIIAGGADGQPTEQIFGFVPAGGFISCTPGTGAWLVKSHQGRAFTDAQFKDFVDRDRDAAVASGNRKWKPPQVTKIDEEPLATDVASALATLDSIGAEG